MPRLRQLIGLPVVDASGTRIGRVAGARLDPNGARVMALEVRRGGLWPRAECCRLDEVIGIGEDRVVVRRFDGGPEATGERAQAWFGRRVRAPDGHSLGLLDDLMFDAPGGRLWGCQLSGGLIQDLLDGKEVIVPCPRLRAEDGGLVIADEALVSVPGRGGP